MTISSKLRRTSGAVTNDVSNTARVVEEYLIEQDTGAAIDYTDIKATVGLIPPFGRRYASTSARVTSYEIRPEPGNHSIWYMLVTYETRNADEKEAADPDNPISEAAHVFYGFKTRNEAILYSYTVDGDELITDTRDDPTNRVLNTADDDFKPTLVEQKADFVVFVEKNYRNFDSKDMEAFQNTTNLGEITIGGVTFKNGQGWMASIKHKLMFDNSGDRYDRMHFEIVKRDEGWARRGLSQGYYQKPTLPVTAGLVRITESDVDETKIKGTPAGDRGVASLKGLDDNGYYTKVTDDIGKLKFFTKWQLPWDKLGLPISKTGR